MVNISCQAIKQSRNVNEYKVSKFEACNREYFCLQYSAFLRICSSVKHASLVIHCHITVFTYLHLHTTFNQDLFSAKSSSMSCAKPSYAFKLKSVLDSTDFPWKSATVCLDKVVYFTLEQTPKILSRLQRFLRKGNAYYFKQFKVIIPFSTVNKSC